MRKIFVIIILCLLSAASAFAQDEGMPRFEFSVSGGPGMLSHLLNNGGQGKFSFVSEFKYTPIKWVSFGLMFGFHDELYAPYGMSGGTALETKLGTNIMLSAYTNWYTNDWLRVYSGIFYGTACSDAKYDKKALESYDTAADPLPEASGHLYPTHSYQIVPVGASFGRRLYGFAEFGNGRMFRNFRAGIGYRF